MTPDQIMEEVTKQKKKADDLNDERFFKDIERFAPIQSRYASAAMLGISWVFMAYFRFKKY